MISAFSVSAPAIAQDRDHDMDHVGASTRLDPGINISVRTNEAIDVDRKDNRVYYGKIDQDVRGDNGRLAIPRGSNVELMVRVQPDNDLILDLDSVVVNGRRYAVRSDPNHIEAQRDNSLVGGIIGAISGAEIRGRAVRVPRDTVLNFRLSRPLEVGVVDRGIMREGRHYHDYESPDYHGDEDRR